MGKKQKVDEGHENYEVWVSYADKRGFCRIEEKGNDGIFDNKNRALLLAENASHKDGVVETLVITRKVIAAFNGEAISLKHRLGETSREKEVKPHADQVHGDRPKAGDVPVPGAQHIGTPDPAGSGQEGAPQG
jgi:hypothetical protein